jgi:hypothetical protein
MAVLSESKAKTLPLNEFMARFIKGIRVKKSYEEARKQKKA